MQTAYYRSVEWRALRLTVLRRDHFRCVLNLLGCEGTATTVHHVVERRDGGRDVASNLRSVCKPCHNRVHPEKGR